MRYALAFLFLFVFSGVAHASVDVHFMDSFSKGKVITVFIEGKDYKFAFMMNPNGSLRKVMLEWQSFSNNLKSCYVEYKNGRAQMLEVTVAARQGKTMFVSEKRYARNLKTESFFKGAEALISRMAKKYNLARYAKMWREAKGRLDANKKEFLKKLK